MGLVLLHFERVRSLPVKQGSHITSQADALPVKQKSQSTRVRPEKQGVVVLGSRSGRGLLYLQGEVSPKLAAKNSSKAGNL